MEGSLLGAPRLHIPFAELRTPRLAWRNTGSRRKPVGIEWLTRGCR